VHVKLLLSHLIVFLFAQSIQPAQQAMDVLAFQLTLTE